jgi:hypothetical protein
MKLGTAKRFTLPGKDSFLRGYGFRKELSCGVEEPIELGVMAISENDSNNIHLLITADIAGIDIAECALIYDHLDREYNIPPDRIWISSSHTHFAPGFEAYFIPHRDGTLAYGDHPADTAYRTLWHNKLLDAVGCALNSMEECLIEHLEVEVPGIMFNRRTIKKSDGLVEQNYIYPDDPENYIFPKCDTTLTAWRFMTPRGPKALLAAVGCHPVTGGLDAYCISGDYPWYFKAKVEELFGCPGFFMLGAAGDSVPRLRGPASQEFAQKINSRKNLGDILALTLQQNMRLFKQDKKQSVAMKVVEFPVELPAELDYENAEKNYQEAEKLRSPDLEHCIAARFIAQTYPGRHFTMPLRFLRLGDKVLTGMPFEVLSIISLKLKEANPEAVLISVTGGYNGYLPLAEDFARQGYECSFGFTHFAPGTGDTALKTAIEESLLI